MNSTNTVPLQIINDDYLFIITRTEFLVRDWLQNFAESSDFMSQMREIFGEVNVTSLQQQWEIGEVEFPEIKVVSAEEINGANAAFAASLNTIYFSDVFLQNNADNLDKVVSVFLEEYGHYLDAQLNIVDTKGDEGEKFSAIVRGVERVELSAVELEKIEIENDKDIVTLEGQFVEIEKNTDDKSLAFDGVDDYVSGCGAGTFSGLPYSFSFEDSASEISFVRISGVSQGEGGNVSFDNFAVAANVTPISNGGFETGDFTAWSNSGNVGISKGLSFTLCCEPSEGEYYANFNGGNKEPNGQISQTFSTIPGITYSLSFDFGKGGTGSGTAQLDVEVAGTQILLGQVVSDTTGGWPGEYANFSFLFTADSTVTTLTFKDASIGTISFDALLDDVKVEALAVNNPPTTTDNTLTTEEDSDRIFVASDFNFSDVDTGDSLQAVRIDTLPTEGTLYVDANNNSIIDTGETLALENIVSIDSINAGQFTFKPDADENGSPYSSFNFSVSDGIDFSTIPATITVDVIPVNDAPELRNNAGLLLRQGEQKVINSNQLQVTDIDNIAAELTYTLTQTPQEGTLLLNSTALDVGDTFTQADIDNSLLVYQNDGNEADIDIDGFGFTVSDGINTLSETAFHFSIGSARFSFHYDASVTPDDPSLQDVFSTFTPPGTGWSASNGELTIETTDLSAVNFGNDGDYDYDPVPWQLGNSSEGNSVSVRAKLTPNSEDWHLFLVDGTYEAYVRLDPEEITFGHGNGPDVYAIDTTDFHWYSFSLVNGMVKYSIDGTDIFSGEAAFLGSIPGNTLIPGRKWLAIGDTAGSADLGIGSFVVDEVIIMSDFNDAPKTADNTLTTDEDVDRIFVASDFNFSDVDVGDILQEVRIDSLPTEGKLYLDTNSNSMVDADEAIAEGDRISVGAINAGQFKFKPDADENGSPYSSFNFSVSDGTLFSVVPATMTINVTSNLFLTGIINFSTDADGNIGVHGWNTLSGDPPHDLWVIEGDNLNGSFVSSSNASINLPLVDGESTFTLYGNPGSSESFPFSGLNLFFNGNDNNPAISVFAPVLTSDVPPVVPSVNNSVSTVNLGFTEIVPASGSATFTDGDKIVELTSYSWYSPTVYGLDRIQAYSSSPGQGLDFVGKFTLEITDIDDLPQPTVSITPATITQLEGDSGTTAYTYTVNLSNPSNQVVTVDYSTNDGSATVADGDYIDNDGTLTFNPGEPLSQEITILVNGDTNVEEDETFTLTLDSVTNGTFTGNAATLETIGTIENDDVNAGVLTFSNAQFAINENGDPVNAVIINRDGGSDGEVSVTVTLSDGTATATDDYDDTPITVTFADGETEKIVPITINDDTLSEPTETVNLTLTNPTNGATLGSQTTAILDILDTDIPDLIVSNLSASTPIYTDKTASVNYRIENQGSAAVSGSWVDQVYLSNDNQLDETDTLLAENIFTTSTPFDSFYERNLTFFTPENPGQYYLIAVTDATNTVDEGSGIGETNNTTNIPITVEPAYRATVSTNTEITIPGNSITFEGIAVNNSDNSPAPYELVTIALQHNGFVREFHISTEEDGSFTQEFTPLAGEAGNYEINAYFPGYLTEDSAPEDSFKLLGMSFNKTGVYHQILADNPFTEQVELANLTDVPLTGLTYTINDAPDDWNIQVIASENLAGDGTNNIDYTIEAPNDSLFTQDTFSINVNSDQGVTTTLPISINVKQNLPQLIADVNQLNSGMLRGEQTFVEFEISNNGGAETGNIQVMLPQVDWLSLSSPSIINSLLPGESTNVTLSLTPDNDLPLTLYNGNLVFDVIGNSGDLSLPYTFRAVSEAVGSVEVTVIDERFYFAENTPKLDNATVKIRDYFSGEIVAQGVTNESGTINLDNLSEGYYQLNVEAENHDSYQQTIQINAGEITEIESFLSRQSVSYLWRVLPTEIEDRYIITIESVFETNVPEPVVTISPALIDLETLQTVGQVIQTEMTLTNHGLIAANDVRLNFGDHPFYDIEPLVDDIGALAAQSSLTIPVRVTRIDDFSDENQNDYISCGIPASLQWAYDCGPNTVVKTTPIPILNVEGSCPAPPIIPLPYTPYQPYTPSTPPTGDTGPIQAISSATPVIITPRPDCNVCAQVRLQTTQDAVMTRSAFQGILDIDNGNEIPLENLSVTLDIRDAFGNPVNERFAIPNPTLSNLTAVDGTGILNPDTTGTAQWTIVPTANAAPEAPTVYSIGGSLNYSEGDAVITVPLLGTPVTVLPQAELYVDYFHQREVFSDDPFTDEIEPSVPFVLGVMVRNEGYGAANNLQITSAQPKIIENEKGLFIDFDIIATELGINPVNPSLSINFGDIEAGETAVANWLFKSSLQGKFIEYDATFEHINDLGLAELSLIEAVNIHELTHKVRVDHPTDDQLPDFLVNDIADDNFYPDTLYFSDGNTAPVNVLTDATTTVNGQTVTITATVDQGWTYLRLDDPTNGELKITQVLREDGTALRLDNFWTSDRTFPATGRPVYEDILHLLDYHNSSGEITYTLSTTQQEVNEPPNAQNDEIQTDQNVPVTIDILANDSDVDGDSLIISHVTQADHGTLNLNSDNTITYTPNLKL
jgi:hypothetical protein